MKMILGLVVCALSLGLIAGEVTLTGVTAQQRYPWNGLVDIVVTLEGSAEDVNSVRCLFVGTNSATGSSVPITSIAQNSFDCDSSITWTRRYLWNATNDVGAVKIDDLALTVNVEPAGVQLWKNGPYWAECNVGASKPEEYGYYFWWGDTVGYKRNAANNGWVSVKDGSTFTFGSGNCPTYDKGCAELQFAGYIDSTDNLVAARDAATVHLGAPWRMPTAVEMEALIMNCKASWVTTNGVHGRLVRGTKAYAAKSIFLPAAGYGSDSYLYEDEWGGNDWSSTPYFDNTLEASRLHFDSSNFYLRYAYRRYGQTVRPLRGCTIGMTGTARAGVTTHFSLDCRTGVRETSSDGEVFCYDMSWYEGGEEVRITDDGKVVTNGTAGCYTWRTDSSAPHLLKLEVLSGGQVIATETAQFALGYIRNVKARQLWPHNKVALEFTVADDIGEVKRTSEELCVWCARGWITNVAMQILGDHKAKPGIHRIVWDLEAEGVRFANTEATFGVSVESVSEYPKSVQLWDGGPYWAECNVGASKPEEYGYYFWWGDTVGYKRNEDENGWVSVKDGSAFTFGSGNCPTYAKDYGELQSAGYIDSTGNLVAAHDAAMVNLGAPWRMPTDAEVRALVDCCTTTWITTNGVYGRLVTGKGAYASKSIFLPAAGYGDDCYFFGPESNGYYWSSTLYSVVSDYAKALKFSSSMTIGRSISDRLFGQPVRPLRVLNK